MNWTGYEQNGGRQAGEEEATEGLAKPNLGGEIVRIHSVKLLLTSEEKTTRAGMTYREVIFRVYYNGDRTYENYRGVRQYKVNGEWLEPTIPLTVSSDAARLFRMWMSKKCRPVPQATAEDMFQGLVGMNAKLEQVVRIYDGRRYHKNLITSFI